MARISDIIESFLLDIINENDSLQISRNQLAEHFSCAPSQINYVLATRFSPEKGYVVESKRGGSGYISIVRISLEGEDILKNLLENIGNFLPFVKATQIIERLCDEEIITDREALIVAAAISDKSIPLSTQGKDVVRAAIFRNILIQIFRKEV